MHSITVLTITRKCLGHFCTTTSWTGHHHGSLQRFDGWNKIRFNYYSTLFPLSSSSIVQSQTSFKNNNKNLITLLNNSVTTTRSSSTSSKISSLSPHQKKDEFAIVKKAIIFSRSVNHNSTDGVIKKIDGNEVIVDFGKFRWQCTKPVENTVKFRIGSHVRARKLDADVNLGDQKMSTSILVIKDKKEVPIDEWTWPSKFPWTITSSELNVMYVLAFILGGVGCLYWTILNIVSTVITQISPGIGTFTPSPVSRS